MDRDFSPFRVMVLIFYGFGLSLVLGLFAFFYFKNTQDAKVYLEFWSVYAIQFNTLVSSGLIIGVALLMFSSQKIIPTIIEDNFEEDILKATDYFKYRNLFFKRQNSILFSLEFFLAAFVIFFSCKFPLNGTPEFLMITVASVEWGLGVYIGRKLCYAGMMLHALRVARIEKNYLCCESLDLINVYVTMMSTLTIIFVYVNVESYFNGPFLFTGLFGEGAKIFLAVPAIISTPVLLIFNFYPRSVLRLIYSKSKDMEIKRINSMLTRDGLNEIEKLSFLLELERLSQDEISQRLKLTINDLPLGFTIVIMVLGPLVSK